MKCLVRGKARQADSSLRLSATVRNDKIVWSFLVYSQRDVAVLLRRILIAFGFEHLQSLN
jgi:hypothetical protein